MVRAAQISVPQGSILGYVWSSSTIHKKLNQVLLNGRFQAQNWFNTQLLQKKAFKHY